MALSRTKRCGTGSVCTPRSTRHALWENSYHDIIGPTERWGQGSDFTGSERSKPGEKSRGAVLRGEDRNPNQPPEGSLPWQRHGYTLLTIVPVTSVPRASRNHGDVSFSALGRIAHPSLFQYRAISLILSSFLFTPPLFLSLRLSVFLFLPVGLDDVLKELKGLHDVLILGEKRNRETAKRGIETQSDVWDVRIWQFLKPTTRRQCKANDDTYIILYLWAAERSRVKQHTSWQDRMNSSRVTTPSLFLSIFCGRETWRACFTWSLLKCVESWNVCVRVCVYSPGRRLPHEV